MISFGHCAGQSSSPGLGEFTDLGVVALDVVSPQGDDSPAGGRCRGRRAGRGRPGDPGGARCGVRVALLGELVQALVPRRGGPPVGEPRPGGGGRVVPCGELVQALVPRRGGRPVGEPYPGGGGRVVLLGELVQTLVP